MSLYLLCVFLFKPYVIRNRTHTISCYITLFHTISQYRVLYRTINKMGYYGILCV